jgi:ketosteroid isomerase-like protein
VSDVVDRVLAALNERDLDAFVACYTSDATIGDGHDRIAATGHDELRTVIQEETVIGRKEHERHVAVYLIADGLIANERHFA